MFEQQVFIDHHIQKHILEVLHNQAYARFSELRPPRVDSNAFSYHLTKLVRQGLLAKHEQGYTLTLRGMALLDRIGTFSNEYRPKPRILTITAIQNEDGEFLTLPKPQQPLIGQHTFPTGMVYLHYPSIADAAYTHVRDQTGIALDDVQHIGDCYMALTHEGEPIMNSLLHVFLAQVHAAHVSPNAACEWATAAQLTDAAPATRRIAALIAAGKHTAYFFQEFRQEL